MVSGPLDILPALARRVLTIPPHDTPAPLDHDAQAVANRSAEAPPSGQTGRWVGGVLAHRWQIVALAAILLLAAFLNLYRLDREGNANQYYTATVFSMTQSWHAFFFAAFDAAGFVTVDKPPLGFWIQAASAKLFGLLGLGFSGIAVLLPEALAGVASVALLFILVRRAVGPVPGLLAALALAITPVSVAVSRNNTIDGLLVLTLLLAVWAACIAAERGHLRWLLLAAATVGLGFEIKMLQAYLVAPAIFLLYLVAAPRRFLVRAGHLVLAGVTLLVVSFAWPVAVDLTPTDRRPYIGSTQDNSAVSLALGYNGMERLLGHGGSLGRFLERLNPGASATAADSSQQAAPPGSGPGSAGAGNPGAAPNPGGPGFGGPGGFGENGTPGPLRLFNQQLAPQASWLLPLASLGAFVAGWSAWRHRRGLARDRRGQAFILWGMWLLAAGGFFSVAGFFHTYYLAMLAPPVAALAAIGVHGAWEWARGSRRLSWLLPLGLVGAGAAQAVMLLRFPEWAPILVPVAVGGTAISALVLLVIRLSRRTLHDGSRLLLTSRLAAGLGVLALLVPPLVWASYPAVAAQGVGGLPSAGPRSGRGGPFGGPGGPGGPPPSGVPGAPNGGPVASQDGDDGQAGSPDGGRLGNPDGGRFRGPDGGRGQDGPPAFGGPGGGARAAQIDYLVANQGDTTYLAAVPSANAAAPLILQTGKPVMALGGFTGGDPILDVDELKAKIAAGEVRFFLLDGRGGPGGFGGRNGVSSWVQASCAVVPTSALDGDTSPGTDLDASGLSSGIYDCTSIQAVAS